MSSSKESTVKNLQELYTVSVGVALVLAIEQLVKVPDAERVIIRWDGLPCFVAFLATLIPFYHGALRHLDHRYIDEAGAKFRRGTLLADFLLLFFEACLLLVAARVLLHPIAFGWTLVALLLLDSLWGMAVYYLLSTTERRAHEVNWAVLNLIVGPVLAVVLILAQSTSDEAPPWLVIVIAAALVGRSVTDYARSWDYYFPRPAVTRGDEPEGAPTTPRSPIN